MSDSTAPPTGDRPWHQPLTSRVASAARSVDAWLPARLSSLLRRLADRDLLLQGSSLAFYGLVSALPTLMLTFAAAEAFGGEGTLESFASQAADDGPAGSAEFLEQLIANGGSLGFATLVFTLWPATVYGSGLRRALVDSTDESDRLPGVKGRLLGLGTALILPAMLLTGVPLMFVLSMLSGDGAVASALGWVLAVGAATALGTGLISAVYRVFSPVTLRWPNALRGAAVTAALSAVFSLLFVVYLGIADVEERFGGGEIAIVVLLGVWLFVTNVLLLAGHHAAVELQEAEPSD